VINEQDFDNTEPVETIQTSFECSDWGKPVDERRKDALRVTFDHRLELAFHGTKVISDTGLLALTAYESWKAYRCYQGACMGNVG
jgi:hypothetical protein